MRRLLAAFLALALAAPPAAAQWGATPGSKPKARSTTLNAITGSIGGGQVLAAACTSGTVAVTGATTSMTATATPNTYPGDGIVYYAYVSSAGTVTVKVCGIAILTPTASTYNVRVHP